MSKGRKTLYYSAFFSLALMLHLIIVITGKTEPAKKPKPKPKLKVALKQKPKPKVEKAKPKPKKEKKPEKKKPEKKKPQPKKPKPRKKPKPIPPAKPKPPTKKPKPQKYEIQKLKPKKLSKLPEQIPQPAKPKPKLEPIPKPDMTPKPKPVKPEPQKPKPVKPKPVQPKPKSVQPKPKPVQPKPVTEPKPPTRTVKPPKPQRQPQVASVKYRMRKPLPFEPNHEKRMVALRDWRQFRAQKTDPKATRLPYVVILNEAEDEWLGIIEWFQFYPVVRTPRSFLPITMRERSLARPMTDISFLGQRGYGNLAIDSRAPVFRNLSRLVAEREQLEIDAVQVLIFLPQPILDYLAWKTLSACRQVQVPLAEVAVVYTRFTGTANGQWDFTVESVRDKKGRFYEVR